MLIAAAPVTMNDMHSLLPISSVPGTGSDELIGRELELGLIRDLVTGAGKGGSLLFAGGAGIGKTAIARAAAVLASRQGARVLPATGAAFESAIGFAGLHQILLPLQPEIAEPALEAATALGDDPPPPPALLAEAMRRALIRAADRRNLIVVIDDLQWLDDASVAVLAALAGQLAGTGITLLGTCGAEPPRPADRGGVPIHQLRPLSDTAAQELMRSRHPGLASEVSLRLLAEAEGNPLALVELPLPLTEAQRSASEAMPEHLPLTRPLRDVYEPRLALLPPAARRLLLMTALGGSLPFGTLAANDLAPAVAAGLASVDPDGRVSFRHRLAGAAVVGLSTAQERRGAHLALSEVLSWRGDQPERSARHLAEAAMAVDEGVARLLETTARSMLHRGDTVPAVASLQRAAQLSPHAADRTRRVASAAYLAAQQTGDLLGAAALLDEARKNDPDFSGSLVAATAAASILLLGDGDVDAARALLVAAVDSYDRRTDPADHDLLEALHTLSLVCVFGGRAHPWEAYHTAVGRLGARPSALVLSAQPDPAWMTPDIIEVLPAAIAALPEQPQPDLVVRTATAAYHFDRIGDCSAALRKVVEQHPVGNTASAIRCLILLAVDDWLTGRWPMCESRTAKALKLSVAHGYDLFAFSCRYLIGVVAAARGDDETVQTITEEVARWAIPRGALTVWCGAAQINAVAAIGRGDFEQAYQHAITISPAGRLNAHARLAPQVVMDLVESAVRTDRLPQARAHVGAMKARDLGALSPRMMLLQLACEAQVAGDDDGRALYEEALSLPQNHRWPFDLARVKLSYGSYLRRHRMPAAARAWLTEARELFDELGATPFSARAEQELTATAAKRITPENAAARLTAQELQVAQLAAAGLSNKKIAERLFISVRTVSTHLYQIYPKLAIKNRAGLRAALAARSDVPGPAS